MLRGIDDAQEHSSDTVARSPPPIPSPSPPAQGNDHGKKNPTKPTDFATFSSTTSPSSLPRAADAASSADRRSLSLGKLPWRPTVSGPAGSAGTTNGGLIGAVTNLISSAGGIGGVRSNPSSIKGKPRSLGGSPRSLSGSRNSLGLSSSSSTSTVSSHSSSEMGASESPAETPVSRLERWSQDPSVLYGEQVSDASCVHVLCALCSLPRVLFLAYAWLPTIDASHTIAYWCESAGDVGRLLYIPSPPLVLIFFLPPLFLHTPSSPPSSSFPPLFLQLLVCATYARRRRHG